ncbi:hypothetical protein BDV23DRAFT_187808 [Aspergillus alliaceus]|uniref:Uncharacterized protein n=1 Tax=Petromyces alliaceus TaxID=209559 RepID=A0A5N7BVN5_PETAA|nr:hypothetical protein BDV23DRAFT_187808 [Aspergillus alliaceus]
MKAKSHSDKFATRARESKVSEWDVLVQKDGKKELVTAPIGEGLILEGAKREGLLELAREQLDLEVTERKYTIEAMEWFITPVLTIRHRGRDVVVPTGEQGGPVEVTGKIKG